VLLTLAELARTNFRELPLCEVRSVRSFHGVIRSSIEGELHTVILHRSGHARPRVPRQHEPIYSPTIFCKLGSPNIYIDRTRAHMAATFAQACRGPQPIEVFISTQRDVTTPAIDYVVFLGSTK
jgi:hypothetical protein